MAKKRSFPSCIHCIQSGRTTDENSIPAEGQDALVIEAGKMVTRSVPLTGAINRPTTVYRKLETSLCLQQIHGPYAETSLGEWNPIMSEASE